MYYIGQGMQKLTNTTYFKEEVLLISPIKLDTRHSTASCAHILASEGF